MKNHYELSTATAGKNIAVRLITMDGNAPAGTISDIREVQGKDLEAGLLKVWNWFVKDDRLVLKGRDGKAIAYRGEKSFIKAATAELQG